MGWLAYFLYPLTWVYRFFFALDRWRTEKKNLPNSYVLSIGNLSVGGTGKTPFTLHLLQILKDTDFSLHVLSRGYGGRGSHKGMLVTNQSKAQDCGDEPLLIKNNFPNAEVIIGRDRFTSFMKYSKISDSKKLVLLDDGFQHHALKRDIDFVLIDSCLLLGNGFTIPAGYLREPETALKRADFVVFTKYHLQYRDRVESMQSKLSKKFPHLEFLYMEFIPDYLENRDKVRLSPSQITNEKIFAFCGVGNSSSFQNTIQEISPFVTWKAFPDHYPFVESDILKMLQEAKGSKLVCTEKDFVKLQDWIFNKDEYRDIYYIKMKSKFNIEDKILLDKILNFLV
jgi:tetraacyldisaccharide 4'-kinase